MPESRSALEPAELFSRGAALPRSEILKSFDPTEVLSGFECIQCHGGAAEVMRSRLQNDEEGDTIVFIGIKQLLMQIEKWYRLFPTIQPFYDVGILRLMGKFGVLGFDCASAGELRKVLDCGVPSDHIIFANPIKSREDLQMSRASGVAFMTLDNVLEINKIASIYNENSLRAQILIRLGVDDSGSAVPLGAKFGCQVSEVEDILKASQGLPLDIVGVSFHVGSGCSDPKSYEKALITAYEVFQIAERHGFHFKYLDIGGGFPGEEVEGGVTCEDFAKVINHCVGEMFPHTIVIAEPGRFFCEPVATVCVKVTKVTHLEVPGGEKRFVYRVNEGVYGAFKDRVLIDRQLRTVVMTLDRVGKPLFPSKVLGDTNYEKDVIIPKCLLPRLSVNDWLGFEQFGSYSVALACKSYAHIPVYIFDNDQ